MARTKHHRRRNLRGFLLLVAVVVIGGVILWSQGDLINPLESTVLLLNTSSSANGFAMVGEDRTHVDNAADSSQSDTSASADNLTEVNTVENPTGDQTAPTETMTLEMLTAQLAAAGVDVEAVSADMKAQGRSLENLLVVVNSGRVTVADLAARLKGESSTSAQAPSEASSDPQVNTGLFDIHWDELGSVGYDLWFMLAVTIVVIVVARPIGWLVNRIGRAK
ncbi:MAG: hypothetical protein KF716_12350 [Anaerolineae bacterium]|nr:hypothetical protein [Anaerolineae bacterium]